MGKRYRACHIWYLRSLSPTFSRGKQTRKTENIYLFTSGEKGVSASGVTMYHNLIITDSLIPWKTTWTWKFGIYKSSTSESKCIFFMHSLKFKPNLIVIQGHTAGCLVCLFFLVIHINDCSGCENFLGLNLISAIFLWLWVKPNIASWTEFSALSILYIHCKNFGSGKWYVLA